MTDVISERELNGTSDAEHRVPADRARFGELLNHGVTITRACHWVDGDNYVFRSTEFDVLSEGENFDAALARFASDMEDHLFYLFDVMRSGRATDQESAEFAELGERFIGATSRHADEREPAIALNFLRRRNRQRNWRSLPKTSSALSHA
ncbi:MAG TPA: hypothetical protein VKR79_10160 [Gaiellaceae bacterium]|nr:hypothetical protein [Gaiellaceae bacterium]